MQHCRWPAGVSHPDDTLQVSAPKAHPVPVSQVGRHVACASHTGSPKAVHLAMALKVPVGRTGPAQVLLLLLLLLQLQLQLQLLPTMVLLRAWHVARPWSD